MLRRGIPLVALLVTGCPSDPPLSVFPPRVEELEGPTRAPAPPRHAERRAPAPPREAPVEPEGEPIGEPAAAAAPEADAGATSGSIGAPVLLVAKLVDPGKKAPDCGFVRSSATMRFAVVSVEGGAPIASDVYVDVECPELATWKAGTTYRLLVLHGAPPFRGAEAESVVALSNRYTLVRREK